MARRRSSFSRKSVAKAGAAQLQKTSEEAEKNLSSPEREPESTTEDADLEGNASGIQASVPSLDSGGLASESEEDSAVTSKKASGILSNQDKDSQGLDAKDMARAYEKYDKLKDTPKHLYGLDGALMSSDEDADVDIQDTVKDSFKTTLVKKFRHVINDHWKGAIGGVLLFIISGILLAFLVQVYASWAATGGPNQEIDPNAEVLRKLEEKVDKLSSVLQVIANITDSPLDNKPAVSEETVQQIVQAALERYNADKVGMADFALESSGAQIHGSFHSETYDNGSPRVVLFGIPLWYDVKPPRVILQPDNSPGNCWAFKGDEGFVVIKLSKLLIPTAFSLEHIPKLLSPTGDGRIPSAPKEFSLWGWKDPLGNDRVKLGYYTYDSEGDFLQTFNVQLVSKTEAVQIIELRILSNHGNPEYTCIYRFRVHGIPHL